MTGAQFTHCKMRFIQPTLSWPLYISLHLSVKDTYIKTQKYRFTWIMRDKRLITSAGVATLSKPWCSNPHNAKCKASQANTSNPQKNLQSLSKSWGMYGVWPENPAAASARAGVIITVKNCQSWLLLLLLEMQLKCVQNLIFFNDSKDFMYLTIVWTSW